MRALMILFFSVAAYAAAQGGYNYHIQVDASLRKDYSRGQYHDLQQIAHQQINQQQQQPPVQLLEVPQLASVSKTVCQEVNNEAEGYQFANQLVQQPQLSNYEHEQQHQQQQVQPQTFHQQPMDVPQQTPIEAVHAKTAPPPQQFQQTQPKQEKSPIETEVVVQPPPQIQAQQHEARHHIIPQIQRHSPAQYNKEFYYLSAPEEDFEQAKDLDDQLNTLRKNIRVVFIRAPENNIANAALQLAKQSMEQQTVVYVLTKQHYAADLANKLHQIRAGSHSKPDVVFIKYRTPEEAEHAQRTIQAQYEALDGPNHFNHDGVAPTHNFVGFTGGQHPGGVQIDPRKRSSKGVAVPLEAPSSKYLPASAKS